MKKIRKIIYLTIVILVMVSFKKESKCINKELITEKNNNDIIINTINKQNTKIIDYSKINAKFRPATKGLFSNNAFYYLVLFGENAKIPMWIVLDKSSDDMLRYDLAYIDRDFDGIVGEQDEKMHTIFKEIIYQFEMENWINPIDNKKYKITAFETKTWDEELHALKIHIPFKGANTYCTMVSKNNLNDASKIWAGYEKKLYSMVDNEKKYRFFRGDGNISNYPYPTFFHKIANTFGYPGTNNSTWYVGLNCLPADEYLKATLVYKDNKGVEKKHVNKLKSRCCYYSFYGDVMVPNDAASGLTKLIISLQDNTKSPFTIEPRIINAVIYEGEAYPDANEEKEWKKMGWDPNASKAENEKKFNEYYSNIFDRFKSRDGKVEYEIMPGYGLSTDFESDDIYSKFNKGDEVVLSIKVKIDKGYFTYGAQKGKGYHNTEMEWTLPEGFKLKSLKWPKPTIKKEGNYLIPIYEKEISFNAIIQTPKNVIGGERYKIFARTTFQYCNGEVCSPGVSNNVIELMAN